MSVRLAISVAALMTVAGAAFAIVTLEPSPLGPSFLLLGLFPVLAAVLVLTRHRYAEACLRITAMLWVPFGLVVMLPILFGLAAEPLPTWVAPTIALGLLAGLASIVALVTGIRYLRAARDGSR